MMKYMIKDYLYKTLLSVFILAIQARGRKIVKCVATGVDENTTVSDEIIRQACTAKQWCNATWPSPDDETAPKPHHCKLQYFVYKSEKLGQRNIGLKIRWSSVVTHYERYITGYTASLYTLNQMHDFKVCFNLNKPKSMENFPKNETIIRFLYHYKCDGLCVPILPGNTYVIALQSNPSYQPKGESMVVIQKITIPDCGDKTIRKSEECRGHRRKKRIRRKHSPKNSFADTPTVSHNSTLEMILSRTANSSKPSQAKVNTKEHYLIILGLTASGVAVLLAFIIWITIKSVNPKLDDAPMKKVLFLEEVNREVCDTVYSVAFQWMVTEIKRCGHVQITYNKWEMNKMAENPIKWMNNAIADADNIVLLESPVSSNKLSKQTFLNKTSKFNINDWVVKNFYEASEREGPQKKFCLVSFSQGTHSQCEFGCNVHRYKMMEKFHEFYRVISGGKCGRMSEGHQLYNLVKQIKKEGRFAEIEKDAKVLQDEKTGEVENILHHIDEGLEFSHGGARKKVRGQ